MSISSISASKSALSPQTNGYAADYLQHSPGLSSAIQTATYQVSLSSARPPNDSLNLSPDELFTKHTVLEVKGVQQRLRADADAKQEELRLMVGERYRDLLQASSSIIAIASSSRRVVEALRECREEISSQHVLPTPPKTAAQEGIDDSHLLTLQVLSAHMKLLLDAPEHLWRLIERQKYLQAAWLFLLARVVHRALVQNDDNEDQSWISEGVDILNEFPLVQRQWDVVSQFRSQIIHKSTLSLREVSTSYEDICSIFVTLHLLDSRPLSETLNALFQQRSKALQALLSWNSVTNAPNTLPDQSLSIPAREVTQVMKSSLTIISQTVCAARNIFSTPESSSSLIRQVLEKIQSETEEDSNPSVLPESLRISTQSLLTHLTSSANFQLLPQNLKYYKPYIDMDSPSTSLSQTVLSKKLSDWFQNSSKLWLQSADRWVSGLSSVKDVGALRNSVRRSVTVSGLNESEKQFAISNFNSLCNKRVTEIWKTRLSNAELSCKARLRDMVFKEHGSDFIEDASPVEYLFQSLPIPNLPQTIKSFVDTPFQKYQASLKRQLITRSTQLDTVISTLEQCARNIQLDFIHLKATGDGDTVLILKELTQFYRPTATSITTNIISFMDETASDAISDSNPRPNGLAFISRVTSDLGHSSSFIENIGCSVDSVRDFKDSMIAINEKVVQKWSQIMVDLIAQKYKPRPTKRPVQGPGGPSPQILQALLMISESIQQLGLFHYPTKQHSVAKEVLRSLALLWLDDDWGSGEQVLHDRSFLKKICDQYGKSLLDISNLLTDKLKSSAKDEKVLSDLDSTATDYLSRTQTLLAVLLPPSPPAFDMPLLQFGNPSPGQSHQSPIDVAKPSPRFGMLLVANTQH